jgi:type IV pilus assembly protein PilC
VCQMMVVGEKSGQLSPILSRVALYFEREIDARLKSLTSILEPIMIILLGFVVGFIAVSIITPIYSLISGVK